MPAGYGFFTGNLYLRSGIPPAGQTGWRTARPGAVVLAQRQTPAKSSGTGYEKKPTTIATATIRLDDPC